MNNNVQDQYDVNIVVDDNIAGVIMNTTKAKKTAIDSGFGNDYPKINNYYRFDVYSSQIPVIEDWCEKQNLTVTVNKDLNL